jgi:hypothetical protein
MIHLQSGAVDDLVVDSHLEAVVVDDEDADAASAIVEGLCQAREKAALVENGKTLLDIASLGHGDDATILADVENTVLLEDRTKHVLDNDGRSRVGDEAGLLMELLGKEVDTEITVLAGLGRGGDANNLARAALEDQEIANANVVAGDGDGVRRSHLGDFGNLGNRGGGVGSGGADDASLLNGGTRDDRTRGRWGRGVRGGVLVLYNDLLAAVVVLGTGERVVVRVVVAGTVDGMGDALTDFVGSLGDAVTERVVVTVFVVISHITLVLLGGVNSGASSLYSNLFLGRIAAVDDVNLPTVGVGVVLGGEGLLAVTGGLLVTGLGAEVLLSNETRGDGTGVFAVLTLRDVNLGGGVFGSGAVDSVEVPVVGPVLDVDVCVDVGATGGLVVFAGDGDVYVLALWFSVATLFVDVDFFALGTAEVFFFVDADLFLVGAFGRLASDREGFLTFSVTFPPCL